MRWTASSRASAKNTGTQAHVRTCAVVFSVAHDEMLGAAEVNSRCRRLEGGCFNDVNVRSIPFFLFLGVTFEFDSIFAQMHFSEE